MSDKNANCCMVFPKNLFAFHSNLLWYPLISSFYSVNSLAIWVLEGIKSPRDYFLVSIFSHTLASKFTVFFMGTWIFDVKNLGLGVKMSRTIKKRSVHKNEGTIVFLGACHCALTSISWALLFPFYSMRYNTLVFSLPFVWIYQFMSEISL